MLKISVVFLPAKLRPTPWESPYQIPTFLLPDFLYCNQRVKGVDLPAPRAQMLRAGPNAQQRIYRNIGDLVSMCIITNMQTARFTVTLPASRYAALKETAARQGKTLADIVDESLDLYGIKTKTSALTILDQARARASLSEDEAMQVALSETHAHRDSL